MKIEMFSASLESIMLRFLAMMAVIIIGVFTSQYWLALMGLPLVITVLLGLRINFHPTAKTAEVHSHQVKHA